MPTGQPILALEKRIAFDGAAAATAAKVVHAVDATLPSSSVAHHLDTSRHGDVGTTATASDLSPTPVTTLVASSGSLFGFRPEASVAAPKSVVFIESDVPDVAALIKDVSPSATIVMLDASKDGVDAIASYLGAHQGVQNVYVFSHGSDAHLSLGTADLDSASMTGRYAADLAVIKASLGANANLLVYGCDFAQNADGDSAAHLLSRLTGASVAASMNLTGGTAEGGDFVLEDQIGTITAPDVLKSTIATDYDGLLASPTTVFATSGTGAYHSNLEFLTYANTTLATSGIKNGTTATYKTADGSTVTVTFSAVSNATYAATYVPAPFSAYQSSKFYGGYNNTSSTSEMLYGGGYSGTVSFTVSFTAVDKNGKSYTPNIAFADSELTDSSDEYYTVTTNGGNFSNVETIGSTGYSLTGVGTQSITLMNDSAGVPLLVTTGASSLNLTIQTSGGKEGFALALVEPTLTLDANNSSGSTGSNYVTTFTEKGAAVSIGDTDTTAVEPGVTTASSATIVLTNAQANDLLSVGSLPNGMTDTIDTSVAGQITVKLSGTASLASYQSAIKAVTFSNTSGNPSTVDRIVDVTYNDGSLDSNTAVATIHVVAVNDAPVETTPAAQTTNKDTTLSINGLSVSDVDANGGTETVTLSVSDGTISLASISGLTFMTGTGTNDTTETLTGTLSAIDNAIATVRYQPTTGYIGSDSLTFSTNDNGNTGTGGAKTTTKSVAITVNNVNPNRNGTIANQTYSDGQSGISIATAQAYSDSLGLSLTYSATGLPVGLTIDQAAGKITGTIDHDASKNAPSKTGSGAALDGTYTVIETAYDGQGGSVTQTFTIDSTNQAPMVTKATANQTNSDGDTVAVVDTSQAFTDSNGDPLTYSATGLPPGLAIDTTSGRITGTIAKNAAPSAYAVVVTATDDKGAATTETFNWVVNDVPPTASGTLANQAYTDGQSGIAIMTSSGFADSNGNPLTYSATGLPAGLSIDATTGQITGTVNHDASKNAPTTSGSGATLDGTYTVVVTASDGLGGTATQSFTIDSSNQAPTAGTSTPNQSSNDGQTITPVNTASTFTDPNGDPLTYSVSNLPAGLSLDAATGQITGTVATTATPGTYIVHVVATDDKGAAARENFNWTIQDVPPAANGTLPNQTYADSTANIAIATAGGFTNPNNLAFTYTASGLPAGLSIDASTGAITGQLSHDASKNAATTHGSGATLDGTYTVTVMVSDGQGGTAAQTFTIDATNTAPTVVAATANRSDADGAAASIATASAFNDANTGDTLTYAATGLPKGVSINSATGLISGTIDKSASAGSPYTVAVTATDDKGAATTETFQWAITNVAPTATPALPDKTAYDGSVVSYATSGGFTNPNGLALTYSATGLPSGATIDPSTGVISGTLNHDASVMSANGTYAIAVTVNDGQGGTATNSFHLVASNQAPVLGTNTPNQTTTDGQTIATLDASQAFSDPNGDPLTYAASNLPAGLSIDQTGKITGTVAATATPGSYSVVVTATDDKGLATPETFTWTINDAPPVASGSIANGAYADSAANISIATAGAFTSPNHLPLTYTATGLPSGLSIDATTGTITGQLDHDASKNAPTTSGSGATLDGTYTVVVSASDGQGGTATKSFTIDASNTAPAIIAQTPTQNSFDGNTAKIDTSAVFRDANTGDGLTYTATGLPKGLTINAATGIISGTIDKSASTTGPYAITVTATDDKGAATTERFTWNVADVTPVATPALPDLAAPDSGTVSYQTAGGFSNPNGLAYTYSATGLPSGLAINAATGVISGTLDHDASAMIANGKYTVAVTVNDGQGGTATSSFNLVASNQAPVIGTKTADQSNTDGQLVTAVDASQAFTDPNTGDVVTYTANNLPAGLSINAGTGVISGTVAGNAVPGVYAVVVTATDNKGAATAEVFNWTITDVAPGLGAAIPAQSVHDSQKITAIDVTGGFTSPNGLPLTYSASGLPVGLYLDPKTGKISGTIDHDASANGAAVTGAPYAGIYQVVVTASDGQGGTNQQTFSITSVNDAPTVSAQTKNQESTAGNTGSLDVGVAFTDPNLGDVLTYTSNTLPTGLTLDPKTGLVSGTIASGAAGTTFAVTITATDDKGLAATETFNWTIDTPASSVLPVPNLSTFDGKAVTIATAGNFSGTNLVYSATGLPSGLSIDPNTGIISGTINHEASNQAQTKTGMGATLDGFYTVTETVVGTGNTSATQTFVIDSANQAPTLVAMKNTANQITPAGQAIATVDVSQAFSDPNGDALTYTVSELPAGLSFNATTGQITGTVSKTASPGAYPILVTATDDKGAATVERFTWTVTDVAPTPVGTIATQSFADSTTGISIATNGAFTSPNGLPLTYSATGLPKGLSINPTTGVITGQLDHDASKEAATTTGMGATLVGTYTIVVSASDGQGGVATQTFSIDASNNAPVVGTVTANQASADGNTASIDASAAFHDPNAGDVLTYSATNLPLGLTIDPTTGMITGTVAKTASVSGPYSVSVTATDDKSAATTETFTWTVSDVAPIATPPLADQAAHDADTVSYTTANGFTNPNNSTLTYSATGLPHGLTINTGTGVISGTLDKTASIEIANGTYTIAVTANDGQGGTATNTFHLVSTNLAPVVGVKTANETSSDGQVITSVDASTAFSDPNGDALTFSASNLPAGLRIDPSSGKISGTVAGNATPGIYVVTVTATDTKGAPTLETFSWTVNDIAPTKNGTIANLTLADGTSGVSLPTAPTFNNPNSLPFVYSATGLPRGLSIDPTTGIISGQLDHDASKNAPVTGNQSGTYQVVVSAADGLGGVATQVFTIDATNQAPVLGTVTANQHSVDGDTASVNASTAFSDPNAGDVVTYGATGLPKGLAINPATGVISGTIDKSASVAGPYTVVVTATDDKSAATVETFTWTVDNVAPTATPPLANRSVPDGSVVAYQTAIGFTNPNALAFTYTATGLPSGLAIDPATGVISGTLNHDASAMATGGLYTIAVTVNDGQGGMATNSFLLVATNQAAIVGTKTTNQDVDAGQVSPSIDTSKAFTDPNGDPLTYSASNLPKGLSIDKATGVISGTVAPDAKTGTNLVTITATDDKGAASNETFLYSVGDIPPVAVGTIAAASFRDSTAGIAIDAASAFGDSSGLPLTFSAVGLPRGLIIDPSTGVISGFIAHDDSKNAPVTSGAGATLDGTYTVTVTADDGHGGTAIQTFTIDATNTAPTLGTATMAQHSADSDMIALNASLPFADPNIGDIVTYAATGLPKGLSIDPATGIISGTIDSHASVTGSYTVAVTATDDKGAATTETFAWTVVDAPPIAIGIAPVLAPDGIAITPIAAANGFSNPNNLPLTFSATGLPKGLSINPTTGQISGTLDHDASLNAPVTSGAGATLDGTYTVSVTASDGQGGTATQSFTIDAINKAPVVTTPTANQHNADGGLVALDASKAFADPDVGDVLTYTATGLPKGLSIDPKTGLVSGTIDPTASASNPYTTTIVATDEKGAAVAETIVWTVDDVAPIATGSIATVSAPDGVAIQPFDTDGAFASPNGLPLIFGATGLPAGLTIDPATGRISGTPNHDASLNAPVTSGSGATLQGIYTVIVTAGDGQGGIATQTFTIDAKNQAPIVAANTPDQASADGQAIAPLAVAPAFADPNGDPLVFSATGLPPGLSIDPHTGAVTGTVARDAKAGAYQVVITATDDKGASGTKTFVWTVEDVSPSILASSVLPRSVMAANLPELASPAAPDPALKPDLRVDGIILDVVHQISGDPAEPVILRADEIVIATVNNVKPLDGLQSIDGRDAIVRNGAAADVRGDRFQRTFEGLGNDIEGRVGTTEFIGSSLRDSSLIEAGDGAAINVETLIRDRTILISVDNRSSVACVVPVKSYAISGADGEPLPDWLRGDAKGLITGKIPAGVETIDLRVEATLTNGVKLERHIKIGTTTGAIRHVAPVSRPHAGLPVSRMVAAHPLD